MPLVLVIAAVGLSALAFGEGVNLAGQGTQNIADSFTRSALIGASLYFGYLVLKGAK